MRVALTLLLMGFSGYVGTFLIDRGFYRETVPCTPTWLAVFGVGSFALLVLSLIAVVFCAIWGIA